MLTLLGLLAMHGIGGHAAHAGEAGHGPMADASAVAGAADVPVADHSCPGGCAAGQSAAAVPAHGSGTPMLAALCLTVLMAAAALLALRHGSLRLALLQPPRLPRVSRRHPYALRLHDPPDLHALSVLRC